MIREPEIPARRPLEPGMGRSILIAVVVGVAAGMLLWFGKPSPRTAEAAPLSISPASSR